MNDLQGKVAVVTGASRGIGEASARALDSIGAQVVLTGRTVEDLERVAEELSNSPVIIPADLAQAGAGTELADRILNEVEGVDVLVNNAGIPMRRLPEKLTEAEIDLVFAINVRSLLTLSIALADSMKARGGGSIINTASFVAVMGAATPQLAYTASKGGVLALTRELSVIHAREGIRVNALCPGPLKTEMLMNFLDTDEKKQRRLVYVPMGRFGEAKEMAQAALYLASNESSYMTGSTFLVDGGITSAYVTPE